MRLPLRWPGSYRGRDELELAAELGLDGVAVNEHHQTAYGLMPSPVVTAAALSRRVKKAKIAILGNAFGLREHPLTLAEEHAMIDSITGGRLITGMVRGIGAEYHSMGANPATSHERFHEAHDLVIQAWTKPGPFAFHGKHYHFEYVNCWPRPYQRPHPHIESLFNKFLNLSFEMMFPPGYLSLESAQRMASHKKQIMGGKTVDSLINLGICMIGSPDTVRKKLVDAHRLLGFQNFLALLQFGTLPRHLTEKNIRLFADEVVPSLQDLTDREYMGLADSVKALAA